MEDVLFQITPKHLENGLQGIPIGYCTTSYIHPQDGLMYRGKPIESLTNLSLEELIYLLYFGELPLEKEKRCFIQQMTSRYFISSGVIRLIQSLPASANPMQLFASALLFLGMLESTGDYKKDCLNVIGKLPALVTEIINHHAGWGDTPQILENYGYMDNLLHRLQVPRGDKRVLHKIFSLYTILHCDIGGSDLATFVSKSVASGGADIYGSLSSGICAISGGQMEETKLTSVEYVKNILQHYGGDVTREMVLEYIQTNEHSKEQLQLFYSVEEDKRATILQRAAEEYFPEHPLIKTANTLRQVMIDILYKERNKQYYPSVNTISTLLLQAAGFPYTEYYPVLFGLSRCIGAAIQIVYERCDARNGMGVPMVQPTYLYKMN